MNTQKFNVGQQIEVKNYRGKKENFLGTVVNIRDILEQQLSKNTLKRNRMLRSHKLLTVFDYENDKYKSFYNSFLEIL